MILAWRKLGEVSQGCDVQIEFRRLSRIQLLKSAGEREEQETGDYKRRKPCMQRPRGKRDY